MALGLTTISLCTSLPLRHTTHLELSRLLAFDPFLVSTSSKNALRSSDREGNKIYAIPNREYAPLRLSKENYIKFDNKPKLWSVVSSIFYSR